MRRAVFQVDAAGNVSSRPETWAELVRRVRVSWGMTQAELATLVHVHPMTVSKWERGAPAPSRWSGHWIAGMAYHDALAALDPDTLQANATEEHEAHEAQK